MITKILVVGGTGMLGSPVVRRLHRDGFQVRVLSRSPWRATFEDGIELAQGDFSNSTDLDSAMQGCDGVHLNLPTMGEPWQETRGVRKAAAAAAKAGVQRISYITGATVCEDNCWFEGTDAKFDGEAILRATGVPYTIFRPSWFMESLSKFVRGKRATVFGRQPHLIHWVAADDYARMVSAAFSKPEAAGKELTVWGPEALTMHQALERYLAIMQPGGSVTHVSFWLASMLAAIGRRKALQSVLPFLRYCEKVREGGDPAEANEMLGAPTTTLDVWCEAKKQTAG